MSRETLSWLNTNTLIGFTDKRGTAWHWGAEEQGEQSNHFSGGPCHRRAGPARSPTPSSRNQVSLGS